MKGVSLLLLVLLATCVAESALASHSRTAVNEPIGGRFLTTKDIFGDSGSNSSLPASSNQASDANSKANALSLKDVDAQLKELEEKYFLQ